jgi:D-alanyl-D-alanine dipeptidase
MVVLADPEITSLPVVECGEPLIDVRTVPALRVDGRLADDEGAYALLRRSVVDRLVTAQTLLPPQLRLLLVEGYRPLALQTRYFQAQVDVLRERGTGDDEAALQREASTYISPPEVAPHVAGAAADLTLCTVDGIELPMGTDVNDTDTSRCHTDATDLLATEADNRRLMATALRAAGLVNYPSEWWHWSYGDRYWAFSTGHQHAIYGPMSR